MQRDHDTIRQFTRCLVPVGVFGSHTWGVVGIVRGVLEERSYMSASGDITADSDISLKRGGVILLNPGSISSFVPNPDHIYMTGVPEERETCISLHLYVRIR